MKIRFNDGIAEYLAAAMNDLIDGPAPGADNPMEDFDFSGSTLEVEDGGKYPEVTLTSATRDDVARYHEWEWQRTMICDDCGREDWHTGALEDWSCNCGTALSSRHDPDCRDDD